MVKCGIVGLPNAGKSTLFNALLKKRQAAMADYAFTTIEPNIGIIEVADPRLEKLAEVVKSTEKLEPGFKIIPATCEFVDIAGLVEGAHKGEGLGNQFLAHIREVSIIVFVTRLKSGKTIEEAEKDVEIVRSELAYKDLTTVEKRIDDLKKSLKGKNDDTISGQVNLLENLGLSLVDGKNATNVLPNEELAKIADLNLLTAKTSLVVFNVDENDLEKYQKMSNDRKFFLSAKLELDCADLNDEETAEYFAALNAKREGLDKLVIACYNALNLISFFTCGPKEVRAWKIKKGESAEEAANVIHSDLKKGFIKAEVTSFDDFIKFDGEAKLKQLGKIKFVGRDYQINDGEIIHIQSNI